MPVFLSGHSLHILLFMKQILSCLIALTACLTLASCSDDFVELPYEYEIGWHYDLDIPMETVVYIENQTDFDRLFADEENKPTASVPFSDGVLVVVKGEASSNIATIEKHLNLSGDRYQLIVRITTGLADVMQPWCVAYVIPKEYIGKVDLDIEYIHY